MKIATPSLSLRLSVIERLLRCRFWKSGPSRGPPMVSRSRLGGDSILITSAPKSASWRTQVGPARTRDRSSTRKRASAVDAAIRGMGIFYPHGLFGLCPEFDRSEPTRGGSDENETRSYRVRGA